MADALGALLVHTIAARAREAHSDAASSTSEVLVDVDDEEAAAEGVAVTKENLRIGAKVKRGPDWKWEKQDGGKGGIGTIIPPSESTNDGWCQVRWAHGKTNNYRCGSACDLAYVERLDSWLDMQQDRLWTQRKFTDAEVHVGTSR